MASRIDELHEKLSSIPNVVKVYRNPPPKTIMQYPCIRYSLSGVDLKSANNNNYMAAQKYEVTVIDYDPDSTIYDEIIRQFPRCKFDRMYITDNLYHYVITLYY